MTGIKGIYSLYDKVGKIYLDIFTEVQDGTAIRKIQDLVERGDNPIAKHANDYQLWKLGEWGEISGSVKTVNPDYIIEVEKLLGE